MKFDLIQISGLIAVFLSCIIAAFILQTRKAKQKNNSLLAGILIVYALMIVYSLILSTGKNTKLYPWAHVGNQIIFLIGPLLYFYIKSLLDPGFRLTKKALLHGLPFLLATGYLIVKFNFIPIRITCRNNHILLGSIAFIHSFIYFRNSIVLLKRNGFSLRKTLNRNQPGGISWLPFLVYGCFSIWLTKLIFFIAWDVSGFYKGCNEIVNLYFLLSFALLNMLTYFLLHKPNFLQINEKYKHSGLTSREKDQIKSGLLKLMEVEKAYRNPLISLNFLSKQLLVPSRYLSQVINESLNKSFYDFVNEYRIRECAEKLSKIDHQHKTILEIAYDVGFNSKSTFNTSFVKYIGVTPTEFRKTEQGKHNLGDPVFA